MKYISVGDGKEMERVRAKCAGLLFECKDTGSDTGRKKLEDTGRCKKATEKKAGRKSINRFINKIKAGKGLCDFRRNIS